MQQKLSRDPVEFLPIHGAFISDPCPGYHSRGAKEGNDLQRALRKRAEESDDFVKAPSGGIPLPLSLSFSSFPICSICTPSFPGILIPILIIPLSFGNESHEKAEPPPLQGIIQGKGRIVQRKSALHFLYSYCMNPMFFRQLSRRSDGP